MLAELELLHKKSDSLYKKWKKLKNVKIINVEKRVDSIEKLLRVWVSCSLIDVDIDDSLQHMTKRIQKAVKEMHRKEYLKLSGGEKFGK